jgi:hypothetical protein
MIVLVSVLLFLVVLEPKDSIFLNREFQSIEIYDRHIYCAPFTGKSIFRLDDSYNLIPQTFTDDQSYPIYDFHITPFAFYINNGKAIDKFYIASAKKETVFSSDDISSFVVTPSEEVIFFERQKRMLVFLDFTNQVRLTIDDVNVKDFCLADNIIYMLTRNNLLFCDEYGNIYSQKTIPYRADRIYADSTLILLFSPDERFVITVNSDWEKIELLHGVRDITGNEEFIVMLSDNGTTLYFYNKSAF